MKYTINYFIKKFTAIPRHKWYTKKYHNSKKTQFCAVGHCGTTNDFETVEGRHLENIFNAHQGAFSMIFSINDGDKEFGRLGKHPRTRILNALKHLEKGPPYHETT